MKKIFLILTYIVAINFTLSAQDIVEDNKTAEEVTVDVVVPAEDITNDKLWNTANNAYINGNYSKALKLYKEIEARSLQSLPLYYNMANSYFKIGDVASSLLYYHRALKLDPSNEDTRHNIEVVQAQTKDKIESIPQFILVEWSGVIGRSLSVVTWSVISIIAWVGALALFILFLLSRHLSRRKIGFYGVVLCLLVMIISSAYAYQQRELMVNSNNAIVMSQSLAVKSSPSAASTDLFILHAGTKVDIITRLDGWCNVVIADGRQGWVESKLLETI